MPFKDTLESDAPIRGTLKFTHCAVIFHTSALTFFGKTVGGQNPLRTS